MRRAWSRCAGAAAASRRRRFAPGRPSDSSIATSTARWIRTPGELDGLAHRLAGADDIALDTEGDSLYHYPERLALIQIADRSGQAWLVDPLALADLSALGPVFAAPRPVLVLHAGDNDLAHLKRRHAFTFGAIFDTSLAARFLGARALGLDVLLREHLGVELPPSRQKDDWSARPLSPAQEEYAVADVLYLLPLRDRLVDELRRVGRLAWVEEECAALAAEVVPPRAPEPLAFLGLKGARDLKPRQLAILRELWQLRERLAVAADRPPFKILGDATLVALAQAAPATVADLGGIPGCTPRVIGRWGPAILEAVARGLAVPEEALPTLPAPVRPPPLSAAVRRRIERLRAWRAAAAPAAGLEPGVLLPNRLIRPVAEAAPRDLAALARVEGIRRWRVEAFGPAILAVMGAS